MSAAHPARSARPRVVVVGGEFPGLSAARELRDTDVEVLLLDRDPYSTFQPLLYQVATGTLNPGGITYALRGSRCGTTTSASSGPAPPAWTSSC